MPPNHAFKADGEIVSYPILIIGAGISGIAAGCQVKRTLGIKDFVIFDKNNDIGVSILLSEDILRSITDYKRELGLRIVTLVLPATCE